MANKLSAVDVEMTGDSYELNGDVPMLSYVLDPLVWTQVKYKSEVYYFMLQALVGETWEARA